MDIYLVDLIQTCIYMMKIQTLSFSNYKAFLTEQTVVIKPITLLIGKNSSGKSSIAKLFTLLENSLSGIYEEPLMLSNNDVSLGGEFRDLVYNRQPSVPVNFSLGFDDAHYLNVSVLSTTAEYELKILKWEYISPKFTLKLSYSPSTGYTDSKGIRYTCSFKGFVPQELKTDDGTDLLHHISADLRLDVDYIGPFRILPDRQFHLIGKMVYDKLGVKGEYAYPILGVSEYMNDDLHHKVGAWYKEHFNGWELKINSKNRPYLEVFLSKDDAEINIVDVGQGMNQALPLVVRANISNPNSIIVLEQPELHLHPAAHADLAELFARSAKNYQQSFIIETHAENFILRIRKLIIDNDFGLTEDDVVIYWVDDAENEGQELLEITIDKEGGLSNWPEGVFNENLDEILEIKNALKRKRSQSNDI
ncbi:hypothetical protein ADIARSV_0546 [Arcticibacter svalbardensis MN12-7]|uniref:AAA domain-containing protein n=2 Tax=Arcticibacter TaxID=1288026 RepID=R9GX27_9SPHI|nr:hypothetical protein ADIARSV_0546 [Arcticibacter svalbardensis MN12-7]